MVHSRFYEGVNLMSGKNDNPEECYLYAGKAGI